VTHGRERNGVRHDERASVVIDSDGGVDRLRGKIGQRDAGVRAIRMGRWRNRGPSIWHRAAFGSESTEAFLRFSAAVILERHLESLRRFSIFFDAEQAPAMSKSFP
jgi:hypothetical protein